MGELTPYGVLGVTIGGSTLVVVTVLGLKIYLAEKKKRAYLAARKNNGESSALIANQATYNVGTYLLIVSCATCYSLASRNFAVYQTEGGDTASGVLLSPFGVYTSCCGGWSKW